MLDGWLGATEDVVSEQGKAIGTERRDPLKDRLGAGGLRTAFFMHEGTCR
jgi:hypothetical protein